MDLENLEELGLSEGQISVYSAVLELGTAALNQIQEKTGIERRNIYDILNKLIERGMISYIEENGRRTYQCTHPDKLREEIRGKRQRLDELEKQIPQIKSIYDVSKPDVGAQVYRGQEALKSLLNEMLEYPETYWLGGNSGVYLMVSKSFAIWSRHWMDERAEKKRMMYDLVSYGTWLEGLEPEKLEEHRKAHYIYRQLPKDWWSPVVIIIFGNKVAQVVWQKQPFAFVLDSEKVKDSFMKYFNYFWERAPEAKRRAGGNLLKGRRE